MPRDWSFVCQQLVAESTVMVKWGFIRPYGPPEAALRDTLDKLENRQRWVGPMKGSKRRKRA